MRAFFVCLANILPVTEKLSGKIIVSGLSHNRRLPYYRCRDERNTTSRMVRPSVTLKNRNRENMARSINARTNLYAASNQWAHRPEEERFWDLAELERHLLEERAAEREWDFSYNDISLVGTEANDLVLETKKGTQLALSNWSFTQLCDRLGLAPSMVKSFTMPTIQAIMRERMNNVMAVSSVDPGDDNVDADNDWEILSDEATEAPSTDDGTMKLLVKKNGIFTVRSITSTSYGRKWNSDIVSMLRSVAEPNGWRNPPARPAFANATKTRVATEDDVLKNQSDGGGINVKVGDIIGPAGLYKNDRNMFIFLVDDSNPIDDGSEGGLKRGFYISNSEVGERRTLQATFFGYKSICGNHIIWGASNVVNIKLKHTKNSVAKFDDKFAESLGNYHNGDKATESRMIAAAKIHMLGKDKEEVVDEVYKMKSRFPMLTKDLITSGYEKASQWEHAYNASPRSVWGLMNGLTMVSQHSKFADTRNTIDRAAGSLMDAVRIDSAPVTASVPALIGDDGSVTPKAARKTKTK